jgi:hypothetical protein
MNKSINLALFGHDLCGSKFFAEPSDKNVLKYVGKCPNPHCNRRVELFPEEIFSTTDKARREFIRRSQKVDDAIFWF